MKVSVHLTGPVVPPAGRPKQPLDLPDGTSVKTLLETLGFTSSELRFFRIAVGGEVAGLATPLHDGDDVTVMLPIGGG